MLLHLLPRPSTPGTCAVHALLLLLGVLLLLLPCAALAGQHPHLA
jgi:hypothetical protein